MAAPSVSTVGIDWTVFSDVKHEMVVVGTPRMIKPIISVKCTNLDPTAFYKIGIDFVRPNLKWYGFDIAKQAWLHMKSPQPSEIEDYDNFKWHDSGLQTGKQLMDAVTKFDKLWASIKDLDDTDKRQHVRFQRNFEYVPVIKVYRAFDEVNGTLVANVKLSEAAFITTSAFHHENMAAMKNQAEGKELNRKRKVHSTSPPQKYPVNRQANVPSSPMSQVACNSMTNQWMPCQQYPVSYQAHHQPMWQYLAPYFAPPAKMPRWNHGIHENKENGYQPTHVYPVPFNATVPTAPVQHITVPSPKVVHKFDFTVPHLESQPSTKGPVQLSDWGEFAEYFS